MSRGTPCGAGEPSQIGPVAGVRAWTDVCLRVTWVMEDRVGEMVGENCLEWCLRDSPTMGRMSGDSGARLRGDVLRGC